MPCWRPHHLCSARRRQRRRVAGEPRLKGFIVSDAHFGYRDPMQPKVEESRRAVENIVSRFPDLDVFVDTGDAHHSDAGDDARGNWTDIVAGCCGPRPLLYCMGNHEHGHEINAGPEDTEARTNRLGSLSCRAYQSWTLKGIHFVAAPQLLNAVYVTEELLEWLELDLTVHRDMTTIIFSHNSLKGTTDPDYDFGYRLVVNSRQVLALFPATRMWSPGCTGTIIIGTWCRRWVSSSFPTGDWEVSISAAPAAAACSTSAGSISRSAPAISRCVATVPAGGSSSTSSTRPAAIYTSGWRSAPAWTPRRRRRSAMGRGVPATVSGCPSIAITPWRPAGGARCF